MNMNGSSNGNGESTNKRSRLKSDEVSTPKNVAQQVTTTVSSNSYNNANSFRIRGLGEPEMIGIKNLGNTCYMSASLQCLLTLPNFKKDSDKKCQMMTQIIDAGMLAILSRQSQSTSSSKSPSSSLQTLGEPVKKSLPPASMTRGLFNSFSNLSPTFNHAGSLFGRHTGHRGSSSSSSSNLIPPQTITEATLNSRSLVKQLRDFIHVKPEKNITNSRAFKDAIDNKVPYFKGISQQDAHEFVMFLLDGLQEEYCGYIRDFLEHHRPEYLIRRLKTPATASTASKKVDVSQSSQIDDASATLSTEPSTEGSDKTDRADVSGSVELEPVQRLVATGNETPHGHANGKVTVSEDREEEEDQELEIVDYDSYVPKTPTTNPIELVHIPKILQSMIPTYRNFLTEVRVQVRCNSCGHVSSDYIEEHKVLSLPLETIQQAEDRRGMNVVDEKVVNGNDNDKGKQKSNSGSSIPVQGIDVTKKEELDLSQLLINLFAAEYRDLTCENCEKGMKCQTSSFVRTVPKTLILHLKRFGYNLQTMQEEKLTTHVNIPLELDLPHDILNRECLLWPDLCANLEDDPLTFIDSVMQSDEDDRDKTLAIDRINDDTSKPVQASSGESNRKIRRNQPIRYNLTGVLRHTGSTAKSGHYVADVLDINADWDASVGSISLEQKQSLPWIRCDDSTVHKYSSKDVITDKTTPYILFYDLEFPLQKEGSCHHDGTSTSAGGGTETDKEGKGVPFELQDNLNDDLLFTQVSISYCHHHCCHH